MKVKIKTFGVNMDVKNTGIEFQVHDSDNKFLGDFYVTKAGVIWCEGRTTKTNGKKLSWAELINLVEG